jgi:hypothetical protein
MGTLGADWIAAIALSVQAVILAVQAAFFYWQARILRRHATTLEEHTEIAGVQAKTAELIGQALNQQGKVLAEQTAIMAEQFKFQRAIATQTERANALNLIISAQAKLVRLDSVLSHSTFAHTAEYRQEVDRNFDDLAGAVYQCQKAMLVALHLTKAQKEYFSAYCADLASLNATGNNQQDSHRVRTLKEKYESVVFSVNLGGLGNIEMEE